MYFYNFPYVFNNVNIQRLCWPSEAVDILLVFSLASVKKIGVQAHCHPERSMAFQQNICRQLSINSHPALQRIS